MAKESTQVEILDAAAALIAERGYTATSVDDIALRAGVAKGSVYYNFGSKADILEAILQRGVGRLSELMSSAREGREGLDALEHMAAAAIEVIRDRTDFAKILAAEVFRVGRQWEESIGAVREAAISQFAEVIAPMRPDLDAHLAGGAVFGSVLVAGLEWMVFESDRPFEDVLAVVKALLGGLVKA
ncbi:TetR/AcrR family transcriptional regulator [Rarobacter faecitabidus]|uniref:TetR family transcriptional regulator n=1 Tax=Rarobacter faecitabidus TaxID=13243 RepID=A0A542ZP68_RARFA|nr:TetR/AcrR family transcriptional regulator [Rarobacter faecitabidus]TQL62056.1 TetR family transcriptional regulator [Rarobacter faecitabidus]